MPEKGTVGASGDLAPLAHLALGLMGEGKMWSPRNGWGNAKDVSCELNMLYFNTVTPGLMVSVCSMYVRSFFLSFIHPSFTKGTIMHGEHLDSQLVRAYAC